MLVLTRKYQEKIRIGENITITVLRMKGKAVRLGIEAPADVPVVRAELAFEAGAVAEDGDSPTVELEVDGNSARHGRTPASPGISVTEWATDSHPNVSERIDGKQPATRVQFGRVPRDQVSSEMPKLIAGTAPLRSMIRERT